MDCTAIGKWYMTINDLSHVLTARWSLRLNLISTNISLLFTLQVTAVLQIQEINDRVSELPSRYLVSSLRLFWWFNIYLRVEDMEVEDIGTADVPNKYSKSKYVPKCILKYMNRLLNTNTWRCVTLYFWRICFYNLVKARIFMRYHFRVLIFGRWIQGLVTTVSSQLPM